MSDLDIAAIKKLKVAELKAELSKRGLPVKGKKDELVKRLIEALEEDDEQQETVSPDQQENFEENEAEESLEAEDQDMQSSEDAIQPSDNIELAKNDVEEQQPIESDSLQEKTEVSSVNLHDNTEQNITELVKPVIAGSNYCSEGDPCDDWVMVEPPNEQEKAEADIVVSLHTQENTAPPVEQSVLDTTTTEVPQSLSEADAERKEDSQVETQPCLSEKQEVVTNEKSEQSQEASKEEKKEESVPVDTLVDIEPEEGEDTEIFTIPEGYVGLDGNISDMNFIITDNGLAGINLVKNGFKYMWAGARANKGAKSGKVGYEVKLIKRLEVDLSEKEAPIHAVRVGWSVENSSLQLGEQPLSYGYQSTGEVCASSSFFPYGETFDEGDVIGTYLDLESETKTLRYTKNGVDLGVAMTLNLKLDEKSLFPHVFIRNMKIELNFGSRDEPWFPVLEDFSLIQNAGAEHIADCSYEPPSSKEDCEVLLMVGLPNSGKTYWVTKHMESHPEKRYCVVGMGELLERCKLKTKRRSKSESGHNDLMKSLITVLTKLYELCPKKNRNFIFDQSNVYKVAQSAKMEPFVGFKRKAVVVVPTHDNLRKRTSEAKRRGDIIHDVPFSDLCDMKCEFHLPEVGNLFDEVIFSELDEKNSAKTIRDYQSDGARAKKTGRDEYYPRKRQRSEENKRRDRSSGGRDRYDSRYSSSYKSRDSSAGRNRSDRYYQDSYRKHGSSYGGGYRQNQGYGGGYGSGGSYGSGGGYRGSYSSGGYGGSYGNGSSYGSGGYGGSSQSYGSNYNYSNYGQGTQPSANKGGSTTGQWDQYASNYAPSQSQAQWGSNQGSWGGYNYNNYNQSGSGYGGSGYSY